MIAAQSETPFMQRLWFLAGIARALGIGTLAGVAAALIVGGVGSRIAMRIIAITAGPGAIGAVTENGNRVGEITFGGTLGLLMFAGVFFDIPGGLVYMAVRRWLARLGRWKGVGFGFLLLATFGSAVIESDNPDFHRFGVPVLNILLFAVLFPLFGLAVAPLVDLLERALPGVPPRRPLRMRTLGAYALAWIAAVPALLLPVALGGVLLFSALVIVLIAVSFLAFLAGTPRGLNRLSDLSRRRGTAVAGYAILAIPVLVGLLRTLQAIREILQAAA